MASQQFLIVTLTFLAAISLILCLSERYHDLKMMKSFLILLCLLIQLTVINKNTTSRQKIQSYSIVTAHDLQKDGTKVQLLRRNSVNHDVLISRLSPFLEDSRSRNSGIEMPLRKLNRNIDYLVSDIKSHNSELEKIQTQFTSFKVEWLEQSKLYVNIPESVIVSSIEAPQIASELASLREYIDDALDKFRIGMESNRASLDTAKAAVEQLLISEDFSEEIASDQIMLD
ncbi:unnamed protein product [Mytilus edulis]|uniref:Uncharacterized protein n=1 Tax=Mytilus edulis TaxID=6550 RepID=A0A8S3SHN0_MYTED|nr:unnamed protein product [Mytilus edulis]